MLWKKHGFHCCGQGKHVKIRLPFYIYLFLLFNMDGKHQQQDWQAKKAFKANYLK